MCIRVWWFYCTFYTRVGEHIGTSDRTGKPLFEPKHSSIRDHVMACGSDIPMENFKIVATTNEEID